jgi:hypothetical protein
MCEEYQFWGLPRYPNKSVQQEVIAEIQGALVDGRTGKVRPKPVKIMKYVRHFQATHVGDAQCSVEVYHGVLQ